MQLFIADLFMGVHCGLAPAQQQDAIEELLHSVTVSQQAALSQSAVAPYSTYSAAMDPKPMPGEAILWV